MSEAGQLHNRYWGLRKGSCDMRVPLQVNVSSFLAEAFGRPPEVPLIGDVAFLHYALIELQDDPVRILEEAG